MRQLNPFDDTRVRWVIYQRVKVSDWGSNTRIVGAVARIDEVHEFIRTRTASAPDSEYFSALWRPGEVARIEQGRRCRRRMASRNR